MKEDATISRNIQLLDTSTDIFSRHDQKSGSLAGSKSPSGDSGQYSEEETHSNQDKDSRESYSDLSSDCSDFDEKDGESTEPYTFSSSDGETDVDDVIKTMTNGSVMEPLMSDIENENETRCYTSSDDDDDDDDDDGENIKSKVIYEESTDLSDNDDIDARGKTCVVQQVTQTKQSNTEIGINDKSEVKISTLSVDEQTSTGDDSGLNIETDKVLEDCKSFDHDRGEDRISKSFDSSNIDDKMESQKNADIKEAPKIDDGLYSDSKIASENDVNKDKTYKCTYCDKSYSSRSRFNEHILDHTGELPFKCDNCLKGFLFNSDYKRHRSQSKCSPRKPRPTPEQNDVSKIKCDICGLRFKSLFTKKAHMKRNHAELKVKVTPMSSEIKCDVASGDSSHQDKLDQSDLSSNLLNTSSPAELDRISQISITKSRSIIFDRKSVSKEKPIATENNEMEGNDRSKDTTVFSCELCGLTLHLYSLYLGHRSICTFRGTVTPKINDNQITKSKDCEQQHCTISPLSGSITNKRVHSSSEQVDILKSNNSKSPVKKFTGDSKLHSKDHKDSNLNVQTLLNLTDVSKQKQMNALNLDTSLSSSTEKQQQSPMLDKRFECEICGIKFISKLLLRDHRSRHDEQESLICKTCSETFSDHEEFVSHEVQCIDKTNLQRNSFPRNTNGGNRFIVEEISASKDASEPSETKRRRIDLADKPIVEETTNSALGTQKENPPQKLLSAHASNNCKSLSQSQANVSSCSESSEREPSSNLTKHSRIHNGDTPYSCKYCGATFRHRPNLSRHVRKHTKGKPYSCEYCDSTFRDRSDLTRHARIHSGDKPYSCKYCSSSFRDRKDLEVHTRIHTGYRPYSCKRCGKKFSQSSNYHRHMRSHTRKDAGENGALLKGDYKCDLCGKVFGQPQQLSRHMSHHTGNTFNCDICGKQYVDMYCLKRHLISHSNDKPFKCSKCGKQFNRKECLAIHEYKKHGIGEKQPGDIKIFPCRLCPKVFISKSSLSHHIHTHTGERPYVCDICGNGFSQKTTLESHYRIHTGETPFTCDICGESFNHQTILNRHRITHTKKFPYSCDVCGQGFFGKQQMEIHVVRHTGVKDIPCRFCGKMYEHNALLEAHIRENHKKCKCWSCGDILNSKKDLMKHMRKHHQVERGKCNILPKEVTV